MSFDPIRATYRCEFYIGREYGRYEIYYLLPGLVWAYIFVSWRTARAGDKGAFTICPHCKAILTKPPNESIWRNVGE